MRDSQTELTPMCQLGLVRFGIDIFCVPAEYCPDVGGSVALGFSMDCLR
jgi:hypothetical protein